MKQSKRRFFALAAVLVAFALFCPALTCRAEAATAAKAECVVEVSSRRFLHERNAEAQLPMASTTKILTAIIVLEDCDLDEEVTVPQAAEGTEGSSVYLRAGETYTVRDLLYGLMLRSGNDCAVTLALHHSGSIQAFSAVMNARAAMMGAAGSSFMNPHGLPNDEHYTTARDLALVAAYAMENDDFREIVSCKYYEPRGWKNKNKMLYTYEGAIGVKTGFTVAAGRCLVTSAEREGMKIVSVVLACPEMYERTAELLDAAFSAYRLYPLCDRTQGFDGYAILQDFSYPLTESERGQIVLRGVTTMPLPENAGEFAGQLLIYLGNDLIFSQNLYIMER